MNLLSPLITTSQWAAAPTAFGFDRRDDAWAPSNLEHALVHAWSKDGWMLFPALSGRLTPRQVVVVLAVVALAVMVNQWRRHQLATSRRPRATLPPISGPTFVLPPLKSGTSTKMTMGLKRLDETNWLTLDPSYFEEHAVRRGLLETKHANVVQCLPGTETACQEVLDMVSDFLATRYPAAFELGGPAHRRVIRNKLTGDAWEISNAAQPLELAARLAMEDFTILIKDPHDEQYHIRASATLFPAGWKLQERIGFSMEALHAPVPKWQENIGRSVNRYFDHISPKTSMERYNLFIQNNDQLFHDTAETMMQHGQPGDPPAPLAAADITVRRERQTFRRLPKSGAVLFTVRTYMKPLVAVHPDEVPALEEQLDGMSADMAKYKGKDVWGAVVKQFCIDSRPQKS